jgi:hypothetical protein
LYAHQFDRIHQILFPVRVGYPVRMTAAFVSSIIFAIKKRTALARCPVQIWPAHALYNWFIRLSRMEARAASLNHIAMRYDRCAHTFFPSILHRSNCHLQ